MRAAVYDTIKGGVYEIEDLSIRSRVPILLIVWHFLECTCSVLQTLSNDIRNQSVRVPDGVEAASLKQLSVVKDARCRTNLDTQLFVSDVRISAQLCENIIDLID